MTEDDLKKLKANEDRYKQYLIDIRSIKPKNKGMEYERERCKIGYTAKK